MRTEQEIRAKLEEINKNLEMIYMFSKNPNEIDVCRNTLEWVLGRKEKKKYV